MGSIVNMIPANTTNKVVDDEHEHADIHINLISDVRGLKDINYLPDHY